MVAAEFWRWVPHPEVWVLLVGLVALYAYAARVIGPKVVPPGTPAVTVAQRRWFVLGIVLLWVAADWPVHDIGEEYLYFVHMAQHIVLTLVVPPVMLLATPEWLARLVVGRGRVEALVRRFARPVPAGLAFNALALLSHWQVIVNGASSNGLFHYGMHTALVITAVLFWIPVCGPFPELRISQPAQMVYLFVASIVPTVPGAWLTFADGAVYSVYDIPDRLWGLTVTSDQQIAGLLMKLGAGSYLWLLITVIFFQWASRSYDLRDPRAPLTYDQVQREFEEHPPPRAASDRRRAWGPLVTDTVRSDVADDVPAEVRDSIVGLSLAAGGANVIMQLARRPIGRGVAASTVESGRVDRHPIKRLRTTAAFLLIAMLGTERERVQLRRQIDRVHAAVRSKPGDPVAYSAFDPDLQLWVAACLYKGLEDVHRVFWPSTDDRLLDEVLYPHAKRLGTTLQVTDDMWPVDRAAFEAYWQAGVAQIQMDDVTRSYLRGIADLRFLVAPLGAAGRPLRPLLRPMGELMTGGFLPPAFREELGLPWDDRRQRRFDRLVGTSAAVARRLPRPLREFPLNVYLRDTQRRLRTGRAVI